ncbi:MFS transporter [Paenibacillus kyungheensis]|uniref:MFS transporter n=1 Tax=Paenibacillus kyungheensis TaxID=1452732 RepID=A0AAX3M2P8_9BACL|nr:MFS transporter [Paenibacillus kyungheensis]WCT56133.1 MFS transporter [Paenibacillus kyungheensis]
MNANKIILPGIAMIAVCYTLGRYSFGLFLPEISHSLSLSATDAGSISSVMYIAYCLALLTAPWSIQQWGHYQIIRLSGLSVAVGIAGVALAPNVWILTISLFLAGWSTGWISPALGHAASTELSVADRDRGNVWINSGTSFGMVLSGPIALLFTEYWRLSYGLFAVIAILTLWWNSKNIPNRRQTDSTSSPMQKIQIFQPHSLALFVGSLFIGSSSAMYWTFARSFLTVEQGVSYTTAIWFWIVMGASGMIAGGSGSWINRLGLAKSYRLGMLMMALGTAVLIVPSIGYNFASAILFGSSFIFLSCICMVWATRIYPEQPSMGISLSFLLLGAGQFIGSLLAGSVIDLFSYPIGFAIFAGLGLVGLTIKIRTNTSY